MMTNKYRETEILSAAPERLLIITFDGLIAAMTRTIEMYFMLVSLIKLFLIARTLHQPAIITPTVTLAHSE